MLADWERDNRMRFGSNAILELIDLSFEALLQLFLHLIILGLFGHHIIKAIIRLIEITLTKKEYTSAYGVKRQSESKVSCTIGLAQNVYVARARVMKGGSASMCGCSVMFVPRQCKSSHCYKISREVWPRMHTCTAGRLWTYLYPQTNADSSPWTSSTRSSWNIYARTGEEDI